VAQLAQGGEDGVEAVPVARGAADAAVHHQVLGALGHVRVQVVMQHPERGFGQPAAAVELAAARGADDAGRIVAWIGHAGAPRRDVRALSQRPGATRLCGAMPSVLLPAPERLLVLLGPALLGLALALDLLAFALVGHAPRLE